MNFTSKQTVYSNPNPKLYANCLSKLLFSWLFPLFAHGKHYDLEAKDLYNVLSDDLSQSLGDKLDSCWNAEILKANKYNKQPKLLKAINSVVRWSYMKYGIHVFLLNVFVRVAQPIVLGSLLLQFDGNSSSKTTWNICKYALILVSLIVLQIILSQHANYGLHVVGMRLRIACSALIYRKMIRLSCSSIHKVSDSSITNLLSNDVVKFDTVFISLHSTWTIPLQVFAMAYLMWRTIGVVTFVGIVFMFATTVPIQFLLSRLIKKLRAKLCTVTNKRVLVIKEFISGIRTIKMHVWEKPLEKLASTLRRKEIDVIKVYSYFKGASLASFMFTNQTTLFFTLVVYLLNGYALTTSNIYVIIYYYYYLRITLTYQFPNSVKLLAEVYGSIDRIQTFLLLDEVNKNTKPSVSFDENTKGTINIRNVNAKWNENSIANTLHDVNICIAPKKLYALVGSVDSGKSSFLKLILGELRSSSGQLSISGTVSYTSQQPWLFTGSLRNNIVFGEKYNGARYRKVVRACALEDDFERLIYGDRTVIGDNKVSLNTDQCTRINLARAVYREADIYLLDDPLSSVDNYIGKRLFRDCIDDLLKDKTRILITHQVQYLRKADVILYFNNGQIEFQGSYKDFKKERVFQHLPPYNVVWSDNQEKLEYDFAITQNDQSDRIEEEPQETFELVERKFIDRSSYWKYFRINGCYFLIAATIMSFVLGQTLLSGSNYWIAHWTHMKESPSNSSMSRDTLQNDDIDALWTFGTLTFFGFIASVIANILLLKTCLESNERIHEIMLTRLFGAPMSYFDVNPNERIMNRFSKDIATIDETLSVTLLQTVQCCSIVIGNIVQVLVVNWLIVLPLLFVLCLYKKVKDIYLYTVLRLKKLEEIGFEKQIDFSCLIDKWMENISVYS